MSFPEDDLEQQAAAMRRIARDLLNDHDLAEDAVQDAMVTLLQRPPASRSGLAGWLRAVVRSRALDLRRAERRRRLREQHGAAPRPVGAANAAEHLETQAVLAVAVRDLGEPYATAVWLRYFEGLSPTEIAHRLGEPVKTVKTRLGRALHQLRGRLQNDFGTERNWIAALLPLAELPVTTGWTAATAAGAGLMQGKVFGGVTLLVLLVVATTLWRANDGHGGSLLQDSAARIATEVDAEVGTDPDVAPSATVLAAQRVAAEVAPPAPPGPSVQVRVLGSDGAPMPFVELLWLSDRAPSPVLSAAERRLLRWDNEAWLRRFGAVTTTDGNGIARWPWQELPRGSWTCVVRHGADYGEAYISGMALPDEVHVLQLQLDRSCVVQVLDAQRMPAADVPIAVHYVATGKSTRSEQGVGLTDEQGSATLRHVQLWSDRIQPHADVLPALVDVALPGIDAGKTIDAARLPREPIVLTLPPAGNIEVTLRNTLGEPIADQGFVLVPADEAPGARTGPRTDTHGVAKFARVGLGRQWRLGREHAPPEQFRVIPGPVADGEVVAVLWQPEPAPTLVGKLLRDGQPVVGETVCAITNGRELSRERVVTDHDGRFRIPVVAPVREQRLTELTLRVEDTERGSSGESARWRGDLVLSPGEHDLGVLGLQPEPLVLQVQFVTPRGALPKDFGFAVQAATGHVEQPWQTVLLPKRIDGDGRFSVFGETPRADLRLIVHSDHQFLPVPPVPFENGVRDLRVELHRGGSVRASIVAGGHIEAFCMQPLLVAVDHRNDLPTQGRFDPGIDARVPREQGFVADDPLEMAYTWPAVAPGRYRLEVRSRGLPDPLLVLADIVVVDGERNAEARLQHLRIPGLQAIELTLPQASRVTPAPGKHGVGLVAALDGDRIAEPCWQVDSPLVLFAGARPIDVLVRLDGHRDQIVRGAFGKQTIELQPGLPVTLRCLDFAPAAGTSVRLVLHAMHDVLAARRPSVYSAAAGGALPPYKGPVLTADLMEGVAEFRVPAQGLHRIAASLCRGVEKIADLDVTPAELEVGNAGGAFDLHLSRQR